MARRSQDVLQLLRDLRQALDAFLVGDEPLRATQTGQSQAILDDDDEALKPGEAGEHLEDSKVLLRETCQRRREMRDVDGPLPSQRIGRGLVVRVVLSTVLERVVAQGEGEIVDVDQRLRFIESERSRPWGGDRSRRERAREQLCVDLTRGETGAGDGGSGTDGPQVERWRQFEDEPWHLRGQGDVLSREDLEDTVLFW